MELDFTPFFEKYEQIVNAADTVFERLKKEYPEHVRCKLSCSDCCYAMFDLGLVEAVYISHKFHQHFEGTQKLALLEKANRADRKAYQIKRQAHNYLHAGKNEIEILSKIGSERVRCPLLSNDQNCELYAHRPVTCRLYGLPISISGMSHTCGKSGFEEGKSYPTVYLEKIQQPLEQISRELAQSLETQYTGMAEMLVPLSMALLTVYDEEYLGISCPQAENEKTTEVKDD